MDINITKDDFDLTEEIEIFNQNSSDHGAVSIFIGKVRPEKDLQSMQIGQNTMLHSHLLEWIYSEIKKVY